MTHKAVGGCGGGGTPGAPLLLLPGSQDGEEAGLWEGNPGMLMEMHSGRGSWRWMQRGPPPTAGAPPSGPFALRWFSTKAR
ncbi:unnamed protein product [Boreogadus saida]